VPQTIVHLCTDASRQSGLLSKKHEFSVCPVVLQLLVMSSYVPLNVSDVQQMHIPTIRWPVAYKVCMSLTQECVSEVMHKQTACYVYLPCMAAVLCGNSINVLCAGNVLKRHLVLLSVTVHNLHMINLSMLPLDLCKECNFMLAPLDQSCCPDTRFCTCMTNKYTRRVRLGDTAHASLLCHGTALDMSTIVVAVCTAACARDVLITFGLRAAANVLCADSLSSAYSVSIELCAVKLTSPGVHQNAHCILTLH